MEVSLAFAFDVRYASRPRTGRRLAFNLLFWTPFWLVPWTAVVVRFIGTWTAGQSAYYSASYIAGGVTLSAGLAALAEVFARFRRYFFLIMGLVCGIGAQLWLVFYFVSSEAVNAYTIATAIQFLTPDRTGLSYLMVSRWLALPLAACFAPLMLLLFNWRHLGWAVSGRFACCAAAGAAALLPISAASTLLTGPRATEVGIPRPVYRIDRFVPFELYYQLAQYLALRRESDRNWTEEPSVYRATTTPLTLIVIIGESTPRRHMGLYGYCRDTTPSLSAIRDQLFLFDNVISNYPLTVFALHNILSVSQVPTRHGVKNATLFAMLNGAGLDTFILSNQYRYFGAADMLTILMSDARHQVWAMRVDETSGRSSTDDVLLPHLRAALAAPGPDKAIVLHFIGAHSTYSDRYPRGSAGPPWPPAHARTPSQRALIDTFDSAVRYQDKQIAAVIAAARSEGGNVAVVYLSDHGEEVYDQYRLPVGHSYPSSTRSMVEIPFLVWLSPGLRLSRPDLVTGLTALRHAPLQLDDIGPTILDLAGVRTAYDRLEHPLIDGLKPRRRMVADNDYDRDPDLGRTPQLLPSCDTRDGVFTLPDVRRASR